MKKSIWFVLVVAFILMIGSVFADAGLPNLKEYRAEVTNPAGTWTYKYDMDVKDYVQVEKLEYGEVVIVTFETTRDGKQYADVRKEDSEDYLGYVLLNDLMGVRKDLKLEDYEISETLEKLVTLKKDGLEMFEWPGHAYTEIGKIPYQTEVEGYISSRSWGWYYIEYQGVKGWISALQGNAGRKTNEEIMSLWSGVRIKDTLYGSSIKTVGIIPANTKIKVQYQTIEMGIPSLYVNYNGVSGYLDYFDIAQDIRNDEYLSKYDNYTVNYSGAYMIGMDNTITDIPEGTVLNHLYFHKFAHNDVSTWCLATYEGKQGWVYCYGLYGEGWEDSNELWRYLSTTREAVESLRIERELNKIEKEEIPVNIEEEVLPSGNKVNDITPEVVTTNSHPMSSQEIIMICVLCAVIVALTITVVILLINRKK